MQPNQDPNSHALSFNEALRAAFLLGSGQTIRSTADEIGFGKSTVGRIRQAALNPSSANQSTTFTDYLKPVRYHFVAFQLLRDPLQFLLVVNV